MAMANSRRQLGFIFQNLEPDTKGHRLGSARTRTSWSPEEDDALRTGVAIYGEGKWLLVAAFVGTRTNNQCASRWSRLSTPLSGEVTPVMYWARVMQRESKLKLLAGAAGDVSNSEISRRSAVVSAILKHQQQQATSLVDHAYDKGTLGLSSERLRATMPKIDHLNGRARLVPYSPEEDEMIVRLFRQYGGRWSLIAGLVSASGYTNKQGQNGQRQRRTAFSIMARLMALARARDGLSLANSSVKASTKGRTTEPKKRTLRAWSDEESAELETIVKSMLRDKAGFMSWAEVARQLSTNRTTWQCRVRWTQHVSTHIQHAPFTKAEDKLLWPFVVDTKQRPLASKGRTGYRGRPITIKYASDKGAAMADVGIGWLGAGLMTGRTSSTLRLRVGRLQHVIEWMRKVAGIKDAQLHFDMVHRLANTPSDFRIYKNKSN
ncbi:hypothetical protein GGI21_003131 [Coemansia aciculifera]|nr:hypothetical protein GGI21_003131 [Coemansia aciculifera]